MRIFHCLRQRYHSTIYALSTPPGRSAIAIIRVSGPSTQKVVLYIFFVDSRSSKLSPRHHLPHPVSQLSGNSNTQKTLLFSTEHSHSTSPHRIPIQAKTSLNSMSMDR